MVMLFCDAAQAQFTGDLYFGKAEPGVLHSWCPVKRCLRL